MNRSPIVASEKSLLMRGQSRQPPVFSHERTSLSTPERKRVWLECIALKLRGVLVRDLVPRVDFSDVRRRD